MNRRQSALPVASSSNAAGASGPQRHRQSMAARPSSSQQSASQQLQSSQQSQPSSQPYIAPATVAREGSTYGAGGVALGWSGARGDAGNLRSSFAPSTVMRRTSVYAGGATANRRQSTFPGGPLVPNTPHGGSYAPANRAMKDPRPVKDRAFQKKCRDEVTQFLETRGYPQLLAERTLSTPTTKDFQEIFKFVYAYYDGKPIATLGKDALAKKFEDEVPVLLRSVGYPFAADISKSHLQAIGAQHSWPGMLAMLHWFVSAIEMREQAFVSAPQLQVDPGALDEPEAAMRPNLRTEMWGEYLSTSYPQFLASEDYDIGTQKQRLLSRYDAASEQNREDTLRNVEEIEKLKAKYAAMTAQSSAVDKLKKEQKKLDADFRHMEEYLQRLNNGINKGAIRCDEFRKKIAELEQQEKAAIAEREKLSKIVEEQNLSEVEIHRLTSDRQTLDANLKRARSEREEKSRRTYDLEIKRSQAYSLIERLVEEYENKATKLGLIPNPPQGYDHIDFYQELHGGAVSPAAMVPDCTTTIKPAVNRLKQETVTARRDEADKVLAIEEELNDLKDKTRSLFEECEEAETRYRALLAELNSAKESLNTEMTAAYAELDRLQQQCTTMKTEMSGGMLAVEQRLQAVRNEHDKLISDVEKLRRDNEEAFAHQLEAMVSYKDYVTTRIAEMSAEVGA